MNALLTILAWLVIGLCLVVIGCAGSYLIHNPKGSKRILRIYDIVAALYLLLLYALLLCESISVGVIGALFGRVGIIVLLGLFIAEFIADR